MQFHLLILRCFFYNKKRKKKLSNYEKIYSNLLLKNYAVANKFKANLIIKFTKI